jgi:hypothetical protein
MEIPSRVPNLFDPFPPRLPLFTHFSTLAHPYYMFIAEAVASLTVPRSSNDLTTSLSNTLVAFFSLVI